jgi:hypothetical protein
MIDRRLQGLEQNAEGPHPRQFAFRRASSAIMLVWVIMEVALLRQASGQSTAAVFIDIDGAYNAVDHTTLEWGLRKILGAMGALLAAAMAHVQCCTVRMSANGILSAAMHSLVGYGQGLRCGPRFWLVYSLAMLEAFNNNMACQLTVVVLGVVVLRVFSWFFADDLTSLCELNRPAICHTAEVISAGFAAMKLRPADKPDDMGVLRLSGKYANDAQRHAALDTTHAGIKLTGHSSIRMLGVQLGEGNHLREHVVVRAEKAKERAAFLHRAGLHGRNYATSAMLRVVEMYWTPVAMYGIELVRDESLDALEREHKLQLQRVLGIVRYSGRMAREGRTVGRFWPHLYYVSLCAELGVLPITIRRLRSRMRWLGDRLSLTDRAPHDVQQLCST